MSERTKRLWLDSLFGVQIIFAWIFGGAQFKKMLITTEGVSITWFGFWEIFLLFNLVLAWRNYLITKKRSDLQIIAIYTNWIALIGADIAVMIYRRIALWDIHETRTTVFVTVGVITTIAIARAKHLSIHDSLVRGCLALFFKAVPQLTLAYKILLVGGAGLAGITVIAGHTTLLLRLGTIVYSLWKSRGDRKEDRRHAWGMFVGEAGNEVSWIIATIAWCIT